MSRGFLLFAHNNDEVDYGLLALCNAVLIKYHMPGSSVCLIADEGTVQWLRQSRGDRPVDDAFDFIKIVERGETETRRRFNDSASTQRVLPWHNLSRVDAYSLSPFEETILLDSDYLIANNLLSLCWGSQNEVMINRLAINVDHIPLEEGDQRLNACGIPMYWATCIYFKKSAVAQTLFDLVAHTKKNYNYYRPVYGFPVGIYRNDYAFSIAVHMMNGYAEDAGLIASLPSPIVLTSSDRDELIDIPAAGAFTFLVNDRKEAWSYGMVRVDGVSVHAMNKFAVVRQAERIIAIHGGVAA
jgi:hypothetical protein